MRRELTLKELVAPHSLRKYSFCLQMTSLCTVISRPSLNLSVRSLYSASLYQSEDGAAIVAVSNLWYRGRWRGTKKPLGGDVALIQQSDALRDFFHVIM